MALYENLPVYKASYDLLLELYDVSRNLSRDYRFTIGERLKNRLMDLMVCIYHANMNVDADKVVTIKQAREYIIEIKLYIRLLSDMKQLSLRRVASLTEKTESISKQLSAWAKSVK